MRARPPSTHVDDGHVTVRTPLVAADGTDLPPLEVAVRRAQADLLDPTASPTLPGLVAAAAARGEDLEVEGEVDALAARGAQALADRLSTAWGTGGTRVEVASTYDGGPDAGGVGLFFTRGADSWSTLLDLLAAPEADRVTHLLAVHHGEPRLRPVEAQIIQGHQQVADELGLEVVVLTTSIRALLDPHRPWVETSGPALVGAGLTASAGLRRLVLSGANPVDRPGSVGSDPQVIEAVATRRTEVVLGNPHRDRDARLAHVLTDPLARRTLQVCWEGEQAGNCGRCRKCQITMSSLLLAGDPDPARGFDAPIDLGIVRACTISDATAPLVQGLLHDLPPEHEELRRAWVDAWHTSRGEEPPVRWGTDDPAGLAGPGVPTRVAAGVRAATGLPDAPAPRPLGWRPGTVPLRPALADHHRVRARATDDLRRPRAWAVVEPHLRDGARDGAQADLALRCHDLFGAGACYLPGLLWAPDAPAVLPPDAVGALLRTARARLWWRAEGDLEPVRLVETIEQGCLPLQVMPPGPAQDLAAALVAPLAALVVAADALDDLDLSPAAVARRLGPAVDHLLAGSADRDLVAGAMRG